MQVVGVMGYDKEPRNKALLGVLASSSEAMEVCCLP